jgi:hypothetical protein
MEKKKFFSRKQENDMQSDEQLLKEIAEYKQKEALQKPKKPKKPKKLNGKRRAKRIGEK